MIDDIPLLHVPKDAELVETRIWMRRLITQAIALEDWPDYLVLMIGANRSYALLDTRTGDIMIGQIPRKHDP